MKIYFDQYQRYKNAELAVNDLRREGERFRILEVGANEHKNLEKFLPNDEIMYMDIHLSEEKLQDRQYILGDATDMSFPDGSFDIIIALDVYEHIPKERRKNFIREINRVSKIGFVISAPFADENGEIRRTEERMNEAFKTLYGEPYPWLREHIENGLPNFDETITFLACENTGYETFSHGDLQLWEQMMYMQIAAGYDPNLISYFTSVSEYYNEMLFSTDYCPKGYRRFIVGDKEKRGLKFPRNYLDNTVNVEYLSDMFSFLLNNIKLNQIQKRLAEEECRKFEHYTQIYFNDGGGFKEEKSKKKTIDGGKIIFDYQFMNKSRYIALRVDPVNCPAIVKLNELAVVDRNMKKKVYTEDEILQNSADFYHLYGEYYVSNSTDPQIYLEYWGDAHVLSVDMDVLPVDAKVADYIGLIGRNFDLTCQKYNKGIKEQQIKHDKEIQDRQTIYDEKIKVKQAELISAEREIGEIRRHLETSEVKAAQYRTMYEAVLKSMCWRMTAPVRFVGDVFSQNLIRRAIQCVKDNGLSYTINLYKTGGYDKAPTAVGEAKQELENLRGFEVSKAEREEVEKYKSDENIVFSVLVPLYNTPENFLKDMIESVQNQVYEKWELCLADGSDEKHPEVEKICKEYARKDERICYKKLEQNLGIAGNTNKCLEMATGDYIGLFDHDDILHPMALAKVMMRIAETDADMIYTDENSFHNHYSDAFLPHYKPDYSPDTLRSYNYICHFTVFSRKLFEKTGYFDSQFDGSQDYDYILRLTENAKKIEHIPEILYYWRAHSNSVASDLQAKPYTIEAAKGALRNHLNRLGLRGTVTDSSVLSTYKIDYEILGEPKISILIPNKDHIEDLETCINSILKKSTYANYEIIIIENNSERDSTFAYYDFLKKHEKIRIAYWKHEFNYSAINNFGEQQAMGDYILLLNNDVEIITPNWMEEMLMFAQRKDVGAVGAMLYYPDDTIQHAGVIYGLGGVAGHSHKYFKRGEVGYAYRLTIAQNLSCVTAACLLIKKSIYEEVGGLEERFRVAFNDIDFCMKVRKAGYLNVFTPYAELYHYESKSRGVEDTEEKIKRFQGEINLFRSRWEEELEMGDPYYNKNLTLDREDFSFK